jgi:hypothetical protein
MRTVLAYAMSFQVDIMEWIMMYTCEYYLVNGQSGPYHQADGISFLKDTDTPVTQTVKALDEHIKFLLPAGEPLPLGLRIREAKRLDESGKPEEAEALLRKVNNGRTLCSTYIMDVHCALPSSDSSP